MQPANLIFLRKGETELLGIVIDSLDTIKLQVEEALVSASKGRFGILNSLLCLCFSILCNALDLRSAISLAEVPVPGSA
jgi:hypothetical protein